MTRILVKQRKKAIGIEKSKTKLQGKGGGKKRGERRERGSEVSTHGVHKKARSDSRERHKEWSWEQESVIKLRGEKVEHPGLP